MPGSSFSYNQILLLSCIFLIYFLSIYCFTYLKNTSQAIFLLVLGGLLSRFFIVGMDDFLYAWDEQFHALVAKNMAENPFVPMLYKKALLSYDANNWCTNHIWLHKQPLFLWQIAIFIKLFGASVLSVRIPSIIMSTVLIFIVFRIGKLAVNEQVGYIGALLFAVNNYLLDFTAGAINTDHNDLAFIFYVTLSIWSFTEYRMSGKKGYLWLIGLFAGMAVLNKWLGGFLVYSGWAVSVLFIQGTANKLREFKNIGKSLLICLLTFIPWQIYIMKRFPNESHYEYSMNSQHFFQAIEHHGGDYWYYLNQALEQYGSVFAWLLPIALVFLFLNIKNRPLRSSYITYIAGVYLFFTIAKTKMPGFCLAVAPLLFIALGNLIYQFFQYLQKINTPKLNLKLTQFVLLASLSVTGMDIKQIQLRHTLIEPTSRIGQYRMALIKATQFARSFSNKYDAEKTVVINCDESAYIPIMFFAGITAYASIPNHAEFDTLKKQGYKFFELGT